jgi:hypothetical protein
MSTYGFVGANPLSLIDPRGLLAWTVQAPAGTRDLRPGSRSMLFPGTMGFIPEDARGLTTGSWTVSCSCTCNNGSFKLEGCNVTYQTRVQLLPGGDNASLRSEQDHILDLNVWAWGAGRRSAEAAEAGMKADSFESAGVCVALSQAAVEKALRKTFRDAYTESGDYWDRSQRHSRQSPMYRGR